MERRHSDFARAYGAHVWHVYGFLAYRVGDREAAEDLTQATFERALRAWSRFDPRRGSERTWLFAIARNVMVDYQRRRRVERLEPLGEGNVASTPGPEQRFAGSTELLEALAQLSDRDREVLALRYGGDLSGRDIAALLGLTLASVQQLTSRSLRKLRELLGETYSAPTARAAPSAISSKPSAR
jgi:RNA polymerase sigma-70 factor, ECF subfamily